MVIALQVSKQPPGASSPRRLHPKSLREPPVHTCMSQSPPDSEHKLTINIKNPSQHFSGRDTLKRSMINYPLRAWIKEAGITRRITFHCFRHTYATLLSSAGVPIYTIAKMLTHRNVKNTQIYAEVLDPNKREAANVISLK